MTDRDARNLSEALRFPFAKVQSRHYKALREAYGLQVASIEELQADLEDARTGNMWRSDDIARLKAQILGLQRLCGSVGAKSSSPTPDS